MDSTTASGANPTYVDFEPQTEIVQEKDSDTLVLHLPGFKRRDLRVQLTTSGILKVSGSRQLEDNKESRFLKEFPVSPNTDTRSITAKFENETLYIRQPKLITPEDQKQDEKLPAPEAATPQKEPADQPKSQNNTAQKQAAAEPATPAAAATPAVYPSKGTNAQHVPQKGPDEQERHVVEKKSSESTDLKNVEKKSADEKTGRLDDSTKKTSFEGKKSEEESMKAAYKTSKEAAKTVEGSSKAGVLKYKDGAADLSAKLKMPRRVINVTLLVILAIVVGLYVVNYFRSFKAAENSN